MKTIQEKYNAVMEGTFSKKQFVRDAKRELSQFLSPYNGFEDSVKILKGKGILMEAKKQEDTLAYECPVSEYSEEDLKRGIDYELEQAGLDSAGSISMEDREKAEKAAVKNLEKDRMHYLNILAGESAKVDKHDQMVDADGKNNVDTFNGMKKAELKENYDKESLLKALGDADDAIIQTADGKEFVIYNPDSNNKDNAAMWHNDVVFAVDQDGEDHEINYKNITGINLQESNQEESIADFIIQHYSNPKTGKSLIDDEIVADFFKTHPESRDQEPEDALDNFKEYLSVNYELPGDYMQEGQDDMHAIGLGYLKGFGKKHSLTDDELKVLGQKVVDSLYKGDVKAAKAKFIKEENDIDYDICPKCDGSGCEHCNYVGGHIDEKMTDAEMDAIKNYGQEEQSVKQYELGDKWSNDFDYDGMLKAGLKVRLNTPVEKMQALFNSFEDVNYHREGSHLSFAIDAAKEGDKAEVLDNLKRFRKEIKKTLGDIAEGKCNTHRKQLNERVGALQDFISLIQDRAAENGTTEAEEAEEVIYAIGDYYNFDVDILHGPKNEPEEFTPGEEISEGRRAKSKGGKVVTENDYDTGGYVEAMGPIFDKACKMLMSAWEEWKNGPMTEPGMIEHAKRDVIEYIDRKLEEDILQEKQGEDHDGDGDIDSDDYLAAKDKAIKKAMKENVKAIITKVLEEQVINEAATNALAEFAETYGGFEGMKPAIIALQDIVTDIEAYYDKTRDKIQKVYDTLGEIRNEEGLKVGGFLAPSIEQAFTKDLRPAIKGGFTKGLQQPKVRMLTQKDIDMHNSGERPLGEEEKQTVFSRPTLNGTLQEKKK